METGPLAEPISRLISESSALDPDENAFLSRSVRVLWYTAPTSSIQLPNVILSAHAGRVSQCELEPVWEATEVVSRMSLSDPGIEAVLLDLTVNVLDGLQVLSDIRAVSPHLPVVAVCQASGGPMAGVDALSRGAEDFVLADIPDSRAVVRAIHQAVERYRFLGEIRRLKRNLAASESISKKVVTQLKDEIGRRKEIEKRKEEFLHAASHELRAPLAVIKGAMDNLKEGIAGILTDSQMRYIDISGRYADRLCRIVNDLLDMARLESGKSQMNRARVDIQAVIGAAVSDLQIAAEERKLALNCHLPAALPAVFADEDKLNQVLINLLSNALKFARKKIEISAAESDEHSVLLPELIGVRISVSDDGPGIPPDQLDKLFRKFVQVHLPADQTGQKGTGLGLAICKEIIEQHGGKIWVESRPGRGAQFHFIVPKFVVN